MDKVVVVFIVLVIMLFVGMGIMMSPTKVAIMLSRGYSSATLNILMTLASGMFVTGLVGLGVMGFIISKGQTTNKTND